VLKELLRMRLQASTTSTSKYKRVVNGATGGRLRGTLQFNGAGRTGRWAGRTFQPQNLPRPSMKADEVEEGIERDQGGRGRPGLRQRHAADVRNAIRGCIVAPPGASWWWPTCRTSRAGCWPGWPARSVEAAGLPRVRRGHGADLYKLAYAKAFRIDADDVAKEQRQIGKVMELMLGYEGGVGAFLTGAATYGFDVEDLGRAPTTRSPRTSCTRRASSTTGR
jgi:DNA polymerase